MSEKIWADKIVGSGSTRPNNADEKFFAAIERGDHDGEFKDRKPSKIVDDGLIAAKKAKADKTRDQAAKLKALRLAAKNEAEEK